MSDLNVLEMMMGGKPGYAPAGDIDGQRLMVVMAVSPDDVGRGYGGGLSIMAGTSNDPDVMANEVNDALSDSLSWLQVNSDTLPEDFTAQVDGMRVSEDSLTVSILAGPADAMEQTTMTIASNNA